MSRQKFLVLDTDMGPDCDDAGALAICNKFADFGEVRLVAMANCTMYPEGACCIDAINRYYGRHSIPVGTLKTEGVGGDKNHLKYNRYIAENYPHRFKNATIPDAVEMYRKVLSQSPDGSLTFCTIGMFTNLRNLLMSEGDEYSPLSGVELFNLKVREMVSMAGCFSDESYAEWNLAVEPGSAKYVMEHVTVPVMFVPYEMGTTIITGVRLAANAAVTGSPVAKAYELYCGVNGRSSWDLLAVYYAIRGCNGLFEESPAGVITLDEEGRTHFEAKAGGKHKYLKHMIPEQEITQLLEDIINLSPDRQ